MKRPPEEEEFLPWLEPPRGGLARLRGRLEARQRRSALWRTSVATASAVAIGAVALLWWWMAPVAPSAPSLARGPGLDLSGHAAAVHFGHALPSEAVTVSGESVGNTALWKVPDTADNVQFYMVSRVPGPQTPSATATPK